MFHITAVSEQIFSYGSRRLARQHTKIMLGSKKRQWKVKINNGKINTVIIFPPLKLHPQTSKFHMGRLDCCTIEGLLKSQILPWKTIRFHKKMLIWPNQQYKLLHTDYVVCVLMWRLISKIWMVFNYLFRENVICVWILYKIQKNICIQYF